jgi:hypothetical protein
MVAQIAPAGTGTSPDSVTIEMSTVPTLPGAPPRLACGWLGTAGCAGGQVQKPAIPTTGRLSTAAPVEPSNCAAPKLNTPPSAATKR